MKLEKVLKFKGIGHRASEDVFHLSSMPDVLDCFEVPFVYGLNYEKRRTHGRTESG